VFTRVQYSLEDIAFTAEKIFLKNMSKIYHAHQHFARAKQGPLGQ
jgi:hypothetical protein